MPPTRTAALMLAAFAAGCTQQTKFPDPKPVGVYKADAPPPTASIPAPAASGDAAGFAKQFLAAVEAGTASPDQLTAEFRAVVADPPFDPDGTGWLGKFRGKYRGKLANPGDTLSAPLGTGDVVGFTGGDAVGFTALPTATKYALRVVRVNGVWKVDWFHASDAVRPWAYPDPPPADGHRMFAVVAFAMAVCTGDDRLAAAMMSPGLKAKWAPPLASDKGGYNRGTLAAKLEHGEMTGFRIHPVDGEQVVMSFRHVTGGLQLVVTLKLAKGPRAWDWVVDGFE